MSNANSIQRSEPTFLRLSAGFIYFFFGSLKLFPDLSPAELIAGQSIMVVSGHLLDAQTALFYLAIMECCIGLCFIFNFYLHYVFFIFMLHQASTFLPLLIFPELTFKFFPFAPTIEGQYIFKNLISVAAGWTVLFPNVRAAWSKPKKQLTQPETEPISIPIKTKRMRPAMVAANGQASPAALPTTVALTD